MPELTPEIAPQVHSACRSNSEKITAALAETLECKLRLEVGEVNSIQGDSLPEDLAGAALAIALTVGDQALLLILPENTGFLPEWVSAPGIATQVELEKLAHKLAKLLLPAGVKVTETQAGLVPDGKEALQRGGVVERAVCLPLILTAAESDTQGRLCVVWPLAQSSAMFSEIEADENPSADTSGSAAGSTSETRDAKGDASPNGSRGAEVFSRLPNYARTLLKIRVPVTVTVARKKQRVQEIVELAPGSIINFNKTCDELLQLEIGDSTIADGEVIKVGDKYGLRVKSIVLPPERFSSACKGAVRPS